MSDAVWSEEDTSPSKIEAALRTMEAERHQEDRAVPARVLNLVTIVDREWRGEVENRLSKVGRYHASRTVLCAVEPGRTKLSARASAHVDGDAVREHVLLELGEQHLERLDRILDPLVITDVATAVWAPHGHDVGVDALCGLAQVVLRDSVDEPDPHRALDRAAELSERTYVVDLAWLRTTPWRERIAATFDPPPWQGHLRKISAVTIRHHPDSTVAALLLFGWLSSRLGWEPSALTAGDGALHGRARARRGDVRLRTEPTEQGVRGLAGVTLETADGMVLALDRGRGGLQARRRFPDGNEAEWTVLGASRGEPGILGEGIRQALLRDPTYGPALSAARAFAG
ncbi:MAG TPA: glucose-6-phosphate dehydrogenase assembly protein OpcA [Solirubrobacteraceae bacterium]|jgi:glucose-6-phosphate dehydrogenase assembly protein OpcA